MASNSGAGGGLTGERRSSLKRVNHYMELVEGTRNMIYFPPPFVSHSDRPRLAPGGPTQSLLFNPKNVEDCAALRVVDPTGPHEYYDGNLLDVSMHSS